MKQVSETVKQQKKFVEDRMTYKIVPGACDACFRSAQEDGAPFPLAGHFMCSAFSVAFAAQQAGQDVTTELTGSGWEATIWDGPMVILRREGNRTSIFVDTVEEMTVSRLDNEMKTHRRSGIATLETTELLPLVTKLRAEGQLSRLEYSAMRAYLRAEARHLRDRTQISWLPRTWYGRNGGTPFIKKAA
jgi:hypothetical protein